MNELRRLNLKNLCHSRMFVSGVQKALSGFPLKTCGNDNYSLGCVLEMASTAFAATARRMDEAALDFNEQISLFEFKHGKDYAEWTSNLRFSESTRSIRL
jgi:hypothetical protein